MLPGDENLAQRLVRDDAAPEPGGERADLGIGSGLVFQADGAHGPRTDYRGAGSDKLFNFGEDGRVQVLFGIRQGEHGIGWAARHGEASVLDG